ncbi:MAG: hypothetical protein FJY95_10295 [Candidatus Handelsmanbacteria bacterium]|nr:hypothetical protein [Candidatus Handelsmanbacteria bacterium]
MRFSWQLGLGAALALGEFLALSPAAATVTQSVRATGTAAILGSDLANAFEQAKKAALREAVERAAGTLVSASTQVEGFELFSDTILLQSPGYVRGYSVSAQRQVDAHTYEVTLDAEVDLGFLHRQLEAKNLLIAAAGNPPLLCLGKEMLAGQSGAAGWGVVAGELERGIKEASSRFTLLEPGPGNWDAAGALALARTRGAEVLVLGLATLHALPDARVPGGDRLGNLGVSSARAEIEVRLMWVDTGEVVAVLNQSSRAAAGSFEAAAQKAARQGTARLAPQLVKKLLKDWQEKVYAGRPLQLQVEASASQLRRFERTFPAQVGGIDHLQPRGMAGGVGRYEARARHEGFQVARELSAKGLGDLNVEILAVTGNTLSLKLSD